MGAVSPSAVVGSEASALRHWEDKEAYKRPAAPDEYLRGLVWLMHM